MTKKYVWNAVCNSCILSTLIHSCYNLGHYLKTCDISGAPPTSFIHCQLKSCISLSLSLSPSLSSPYPHAFPCYIGHTRFHFTYHLIDDAWYLIIQTLKIRDEIIHINLKCSTTSTVLLSSYTPTFIKHFIEICQHTNCISNIKCQQLLIKFFIKLCMRFSQYEIETKHWKSLFWFRINQVHRIYTRLNFQSIFTKFPIT